MPLPALSMEMASHLAETASRAEFIATVKELRETTPSRQSAVLQRVASIDYMESLGISFPTGSRLSPRSFEDAKDTKKGNRDSSCKPMTTFANGLTALEYQGFLITVVDKESQKGTTSQAIPSAVEKSRENVRTTIRRSLEEIAAFVAKPEFRCLLEDLYALPEPKRAQFVLDAILNPKARAQRGIVVPNDMVIQRSTFADGRPTLFCVSKLVPLAYPWRKVTVTFDSSAR